MAHKGSVSVATSKLTSIAAERGAQVETTSGYLIITKRGEPNRQVLVERFVKKGSTESVSRWVELRGKGKVPFVSSSPGVVPHQHSSPSITHRLDTDSDEATVLEQFGLLIGDLMGAARESEQAAA